MGLQALASGPVHFSPVTYLLQVNLLYKTPSLPILQDCSDGSHLIYMKHYMFINLHIPANTFKDKELQILYYKVSLGEL